MQKILSDAIENSFGIIAFSLDKSYKYTSFTSLHKQIMKKIWNADISVGDNMLDFLSEPDKSKAQRNFNYALSGENISILEEYGDEKLQRSFWENKYSPVYDVNNQIIGLAVFVLDVSSHVEISKKLEETQYRLNIALESGQIGVWEWDVRPDKIFWSEHMYTIFGIDTNTDLKLDTYLPLLHPDDKDHVLQVIQNGIESKKDYEVTHRVILKDNSTRWILGKAKIVTDHEDQVKKIIGTCLDITKQKNNELELMLKNEELTKTNAELDKFVYSASHDLRAPVASMLGLVDLTRREKNNENLLQLFDLQEKSLKRMDNFIHDIINFSRNSRLELELQKIDFEAIINESFEQIHFLNNASKIKKIISINDGISFVSDAKRIQIIMNNIISNAVKYYDAGKNESFVKINVETFADKVVILISDNGIGINKNDLDKIFNMFYRATEIGKGSGLGLYIVKEVVEKLKGNIDYQSAYGLGTEVKITLSNFVK